MSSVTVTTAATTAKSRSIPLRGLSTFQTESGTGIVKASVLSALEIGYRHIHTAFAYGAGDVEKEVGDVIRESGVPREKLFIVSKLHNMFHEPGDVETGLDWTLKNLGLGYTSLSNLNTERKLNSDFHEDPYSYAPDSAFNTIRRSDGSGKPLIDIPQSQNYPETWKSMEALLSTGKARSIGVSNFNVLKLKRLLKTATVSPRVNQVEFNPYFPQVDLLEFCNAHGIRLVAHCPLGGAIAPEVTGRKGNGPLEDPTVRTTLRKNNPQYFPHLTGSFEITRIARLHSRTAAQVILAWIIGRGVCVIPKSNSRTRLAENFDVLFRLTAEEDAEIGNLMGPRGERAVRNLDSRHHIGFDCYDEESDQPVPI